MKLNLRHLHAFREVAQLGSISAAARSVHLTQPAVTQAIAQIEDHFGALLFTRSSTGMQLTAAGEICTERIDRALRALNDGITELRAAGRDPGSLIRIMHGMRTAQLRALTAIAQHRNFTLAARSSHMAQPTIHRAARELERLLGVALFEKTSYGIVPTSGAEYLARRAGVAFAELEQARAEIAALNGNEQGRTVVGACSMAQHPFLIPEAFIEFTLKCPEHGISILNGTYEHLVASLRIGETDFLIGPLRSSDLPHDVAQEHLFDDPLGIIVRADHPLARRKRLTTADLSRYPWIAPRRGAPLRSDFESLFQLAGVSAPERPIECNSLSSVRAFLLASNRMMLVSPHHFRDDLKVGTLTLIAHPVGPVVRPMGLISRRDWRPTSTQAGLLEVIRQRSRRAQEWAADTVRQGARAAPPSAPLASAAACAQPFSASSQGVTG
ncbi:MAG TPA: LysR family transcriptional regulator [Steroidobacteraceae bacterium]|jgi:DNA-binding transcriptional LysR family regulator|nr:LysR family transcriptional regulator [Steroidobacteraceae bacterium]